MSDFNGSPEEEMSPTRLDPAKVPEELRHLISLAEQFGIEDEDLRREAIRQLPADMAARLRTIVEDYEQSFDDWLAGPEAGAEEHSDEYVAFTHPRIAAEGHDT
jgi:hypothetical protein